MKTVAVRLWDEAIAKGALQIPSELRDLTFFLQSRPEPKTVMEIGTAKGGTLWLWCRLAALDATIISVDLPGGPFGGGYGPADVARIAAYKNPDQRLHLLGGDSHSKAMRGAVERALAGRQLDLLFIDGDHSLDGVTKDWDDYSPFVCSGGLVVFHDIAPHEQDPACQVKPLWDRLKEEHEHYEFRSGADWAGIGVIIV